MGTKDLEGFKFERTSYTTAGVVAFPRGRWGGQLAGEYSRYDKSTKNTRRNYALIEMDTEPSASRIAQEHGQRRVNELTYANSVLLLFFASLAIRFSYSIFFLVLIVNAFDTGEIFQVGAKAHIVQEENKLLLEGSFDIPPKPDWF